VVSREREPPPRAPVRARAAKRAGTSGRAAVSRVMSGSRGRLLLHRQAGEMAERAARSTAVLVCQGRAIAGGLYAVAGSPIRSDRTGAPLSGGSAHRGSRARRPWDHRPGRTSAGDHLQPGLGLIVVAMVGSAAGSWGGVERVENSLGDGIVSRLGAHAGRSKEWRCRLRHHLSPHMLWLGRETLSNSVKAAMLRRP
jgi:hypothetical protein